MISFRPLRETLSQRDISIYRLEADKVFGKATTDTLKNDSGNVNTKTLNAICKYLNCTLQDVAEYIPDNEP